MSMLKRQFSPTLEASVSSVSSPLFTIPIRPSHWALRLGSKMTLVTGVIDRRCEDYNIGYLHRSCRNLAEFCSDIILFRCPPITKVSRSLYLLSLNLAIRNWDITRFSYWLLWIEEHLPILLCLIVASQSVCVCSRECSGKTSDISQSSDEGNF